MIVGNYEFDINEMTNLNGRDGYHFALIRDGKTLVEIYDGTDCDEDGKCHDIWVYVDDKKFDWTWELIEEFREELEYEYENW